MDTGSRPNVTIRCEGCGSKLEHSYSFHRVNASEASLVMSPDGTGFITTVRAVVTCSWRCLAKVAERHAEPDVEDDPF